jgi:membrane-associated phospholipid phosphatase
VKGVWGGTLEEGRRAAVGIIDLEQKLGIYVEPDAQRFFVQHDLGMPFWNAFYVVSQVVVLPLTLFLVYRYRRGSYAFVRNMAFLSWTAGVIWYALQPVAPPRLLVDGLSDTVSSQTFFDLDSDFIRAFYNPVAAMPSLHVGMAPVVAWALIRLTPWLWTRVLGVLYPLLVAVSIVVTGNHFILDIAGGLAVVLPAAAI